MKRVYISPALQVVSMVSRNIVCTSLTDIGGSLDYGGAGTENALSPELLTVEEIDYDNF